MNVGFIQNRQTYCICHTCLNRLLVRFHQIVLQYERWLCLITNVCVLSNGGQNDKVPHLQLAWVWTLLLSAWECENVCRSLVGGREKSINQSLVHKKTSLYTTTYMYVDGDVKQSASKKTK
jgi:hypothetical protein